MADAPTNWIDFAISLSPVVQTGIWAGVAFTALLMLRKPIRQLASELVQRVNQGDDVSTPWLSIEKREERERKVVQQVAENIRGELHVKEEKLGKLSEIAEADIDEILDIVSNKFIELEFAADEFQTSDARDAKIALYMTNWETVSDFLNEAYMTARAAGVDLPIWSYGRYWHLKNVRTGEFITKSRLGEKYDSGSFLALGITAGDKLIAKRTR